MKFRGVIPILVTPFNNDESVDVNSIHTMIQLMKNIEVDAVDTVAFHLEVDGTRDNVTWRQFGAFVMIRHEAVATDSVGQTQLPTLTPYRFRN